MTDAIKPAAFARGVPASERNGIYGLEETLMSTPDTPIVTVTTWAVSEIVEKRIAGEVYPVLEPRHIEPLRTKEAIEAALQLQADAYKARTSTNQLPIEEPEIDLEQPLDEKDREWEAAAPKAAAPKAAKK